MAGGGLGNVDPRQQRNPSTASPFGGSMVTARPEPINYEAPQPGRPYMGVGIQPMQPYGQPTMTYEAAQMRQMQQDVKSPAEQAAIDAALAGGPGGAPVSWADDKKIGLSTGLMSAVGSAPTVQQPCPQQPYGVMKPANPFQPQNFEQRLSSLEEWQKTRV